MAHETQTAQRKVQLVEQNTLTLPPMVVSPADVARLVSELEMINTSLLQLGLRASGTEVKMPKTSRLMDLTAEHNKLNLLRQADRAALKRFLEQVLSQAPRLHFSFGADPAPAFMEKLMTWLRQKIHPYALVTVGLQPNIGAGCIMRSTNKYFDFSLGRTFAKNRGLLLGKLAPGEPEAQGPEQ